MAQNVSHEQSLRWVSRELDHELTSVDQRSLEQHLRSCDSCRRAADDLKLLSGVMRAADKVRAPAGLAARAIQFHGGKVRRRFEVEAETRLLTLARVGALAAGIVLLVTCFFAFGGPNGRLHRSELHASSTTPLDRLLVGERVAPGAGVEILWQKLFDPAGRIR